MKIIRVVAAVITSTDSAGRPIILATQRGYGPMAGGWEFPGGKVEPGESPSSALHREIREELSTSILIQSELTTVEYDYPEFHLSMKVYLCTADIGKMKLLEHKDARWLRKEELSSVDWLPADITIIDELKEVL